MRAQEVPSQAGQNLTPQIPPVSMGVPGQMILHEPQPFRKQGVLSLLFNSVALVTKIQLSQKQMAGG